MTIRFDDAFDSSIEVIRSQRDKLLKDSGRVVVVRDLLGRIRVILERKPLGSLDSLYQSLTAAAGPFYAGKPLLAEDMLNPDSVFASPDLRTLEEVETLDRLVSGVDWTRRAISVSPNKPRAALFGIKGGVGRSTTLCIWARYLAERGKRVLVIDLDLESPGVSTMLLAPELIPDFGVVDWLVEDAASNADDEILRLMVARSNLANSTSGEVLIVPCMGQKVETYMDKLSRAYVDIPNPTSGPQTFADRLARMTAALEKECSPDIVLLDSRAGLHDIAGIVTTRLNATVFLFAVESRQTWVAYQVLFNHWSKTNEIALDVRERLKLVAANVPELERESYINRFTQNAYDLFSETLYEESDPQKKTDAFNFDIMAVDAPHYPLVVHWSRVIQDWDPLSGGISSDEIKAIYGDFVRGATELALGLDSDDD